MLVGLGRHHHTWELVEASGALALHLLREDNLDLALNFGLRSGRDHDMGRGRIDGKDRASPAVMRHAATPR